MTALFDDPSEREWLTSRLAPLVGSAGDGSAVGRDEAFAAWRRFLEAMAARHPLVLVVEDVHWADEALLDFLEHLLDWAAPVPLLDPRHCAARALRPPARLERRKAKRHDDRGFAALVRGDRPTPAGPPRTRTPARRAPRRPFSSALGATPCTRSSSPGCSPSGESAAELPLPEGVQALIAARLDTLPPETKALLQDASVVGRTFWTGAVAAIGGRDADAVQAGIRELVRREFVRPVRVSSVKGAGRVLDLACPRS